MNEEYKLLRNEIYDNIKKQDVLNNLIITLLGFSIVFTTWYEHIVFLLAVLFISDVLLSRIIHCRNVVYYISTYLAKMELNSDEIQTKWENDISEFKNLLLNKQRKGITKIFLIKSVFKVAFIMKNFSNIIFSTYLFFQIIVILETTRMPSVLFVIAYILAVLAYGLNLLFTIIICADRKLKLEYKNIWDEVKKQ